LGVTLVRANFDAAVYLIVVVAAQALAFYRRAQEREQHAIALAAGLTRAKLDALRLQLQPHFLFNTLNAISTLVHRDANAADELIGDLSDLLRVSLQTSDHEVTLRQELELLDRYLAIEKTRLGSRLKVETRMDDDAGPALVPTFVLQPIVENSIRHGIEPRLAPGTIRIRAERHQRQLILTVEDNGVGRTGQSAGVEPRRGIGLANTEERLKALHGDAAQLMVTTPENGGFSVRIVLPFTTARASSAAADGSASQPV
jgi:sensor histidine kinase YesM